MAKKALLIGGSYFIGRVFSILCSRSGGWELHVVNRGNAPLDRPGISEYVCDRHDVPRLVGMLPDGGFDVLVDSCAYDPGDIAPLVDAIGDRIGQYLYLGTASVYANGDHAVRKEGDPVVYASDDAIVSEHICGKAELERELADSCGERGIPWTVLRPTFVYGPYDYVPRESWYIGKVLRGEPVPATVDGTARFSLVYVADVAAAMQLAVGDDRAYGQTFNLSAPEEITEARFLDELERLHGPFERKGVTVAEAMNRNIAIPWPLAADELYDGTGFSETFGLAYTPFEVGMERTYAAFRDVLG